MSASRMQRMQEVLARRQPDLTVVMAGVHKEHNVSAVIRSCDAVGVPVLHSMGQEGRLAIKRTASAGITRWVELRQHEAIDDGLTALRGAGMQILAADATPRAVDFRTVDFTRPTAIVLGRELAGMPPRVAAHADADVAVPMLGLTASLNVSVAAAVLLYEAQRQRAEAGLYDRCRLDPELYRRTLFEWLQPKVARFCRRRGLAYPELDDEGHVVSGPHAGGAPSAPPGG